MDEEITRIVAEAEERLSAVTSRSALDEVKALFFGGSGSFTAFRKRIGELPKEEKPAFGKKVNELKTRLEAVFDEAVRKSENEEFAKRLGPEIDPTLPSPDPQRGCIHPLTKVRNRIVEIFRRIGFSVVEGTDVETEYYCFDALNTPPDHPARDLHDTYYLKWGTDVSNVTKSSAEERYLLRTHTSSTQIRTMLANKPPIRIISPGRCFRRDTADATHSANFHQVEGLYVDRNVTVRDLKAVLDYFVGELLGKGAKTRFRPHFFPYTEPSFEVDFPSGHLGKVGSDWIEIMGCGMVDPAVFESVGYDPEEYSGFAFGMGVERVAMNLYGIDDIRYFYQNDERFLRQFS
ncbi:MAG: phenylalanine--tRNA ligase subunit alpha [Verrucomicrobiota bacterium]